LAAGAGSPSRRDMNRLRALNMVSGLGGWSYVCCDGDVSGNVLVVACATEAWLGVHKVAGLRPRCQPQRGERVGSRWVIWTPAQLGLGRHRL
jgi:hypothetical protein